MRVVVIGTKNGKAAVAGKNGCMCYIKDNGYQKGQILEVDDALFGKRAIEGGGTIVPFKEPSLRAFTPKASGIVAAICAAAVTGGMFVYASPVRSVSDDSEPGIEYSVNLFDRVIGVSAGTSEAEIETGVIYREVSGKKIDEAMEITRKLIEKEHKDDGTVDETGSSDYHHEDTPKAEDVLPGEKKPSTLEEIPNDNTEITAPPEPENGIHPEEKPQGDENVDGHGSAPEKSFDNSGFNEQEQPEPNNGAQPDEQNGRENLPPPPEGGHQEPEQSQNNAQPGDRPPEGGPPSGEVPPGNAGPGSAQLGNVGPGEVPPGDPPPGDATPPGNTSPH